MQFPVKDILEMLASGSGMTNEKIIEQHPSLEMDDIKASLLYAATNLKTTIIIDAAWWELWLDHHISPVIAKWLKEKFNLQVKSSYALQSQTISDFELYNKAKKLGNIIIITEDSDLEEIVESNGSPPKLSNLKIGNCDNRILFSILIKHVERALRLLIDFDKDVVHIEITN